MADTAVRARLLLLLARRAPRIGPTAVVAGAIVSFAVFAASATFVLVLTRTYRHALSAFAGTTDAIVLVSAAFVVSAMLGGFAAGVLSRTTDAKSGGVHGALSSVVAGVLAAIVGDAWHAFGSVPSLALIVVAACALGSATIGGRYGARINEDDGE